MVCDGLSFKFLTAIGGVNIEYLAPFYDANASFVA